MFYYSLFAFLGKLFSMFCVLLSFSIKPDMVIDQIQVRYTGVVCWSLLWFCVTCFKLALNRQLVTVLLTPPGMGY